MICIYAASNNGILSYKEYCIHRYISRVESEMYALQLRVKFLEKYIQSVTMQIESFEQVHLAPQRYIQLLAEAFRRRVFSTKYMKVILSMSENFYYFSEFASWFQYNGRKTVKKNIKIKYWKVKS